MANQEIPRDQWVTFFNSFSKRHYGQRATLEVPTEGNGEKVESREAKFQEISADVKDRESNITIALGEPGEGIRHIISQVTHLKHSADGGAEAIEIEGREGGTTRLRVG